MILNTAAFAAICLKATVDMSSRAISVLHDLITRRSDLAAENGTTIATAVVAAIDLVRFRPDCASAVSRLLAQVAAPQRKRSLQRTARAMVNHAPALLLGYTRAVCRVSHPLSASSRTALEPGVLAICEMVSMGQDRDRQGEALASAWGVGDGQSGAAELQVWAQVWGSYQRKRYTGQG
jgi:hypothetical protein